MSNNKYLTKLALNRFERYLAEQPVDKYPLYSPLDSARYRVTAGSESLKRVPRGSVHVHDSQKNSGGPIRGHRGTSSIAVPTDFKNTGDSFKNNKDSILKIHKATHPIEKANRASIGGILSPGILAFKRRV